MNTRMHWTAILLVGIGLLAIGCGDGQKYDDDKGDKSDKKTPATSEVVDKATPAVEPKAETPVVKPKAETPVVAPKAGTPAASTASTPKAAVLNMARAMEQGDEGLFLSSVNVDDKEMAKVMFGQISAMYAYNKKFVAAYGRAPGKNGKKMPTIDELATKVKIEENGDKATAEMPDKGGKMNLVKTDGAWKVDMGAAMPTSEQRDKTLKMARIMTGVVREATTKIGGEGYTAEKIEQEFNVAMMKAVMSAAMAERAEKPVAPTTQPASKTP